ncbi:hypothetical protein ACO0LB_17045 [Undibacterium sp. SXout7W]|uniref:hypothetical protein n=1 Tax=Undibacterium sp. SXout7W TaxID=3413049 RepID=UPI003BF0B747
MKEFTEEYGFVDSGIFAVALSQVLPVELVVLRAHQFVIHACCRYEQYYLDAFGVSTQRELIQRVGREYQHQDMVLSVVSQDVVLKLSNCQPDELLRAKGGGTAISPK